MMSFDPVSYAMGAKSGGGGGSGGGVLVVRSDPQTGALDHTWQEIADAGCCILYLPQDENTLALCPLFSVVADDNDYEVGFIFYDAANSTYFPVYGVTDSANGYPVPQNGD